MAKAKTVFVCNECGYESAKWLGKCPACNQWNTFYEEKIMKTADGLTGEKKSKSVTPVELNKVEGKDSVRTSTGIRELDRVLGGGMVKGSLILLGGEPGIGKSTLILQICDKIPGEGKVLRSEEHTSELQSPA